MTITQSNLLLHILWNSKECLGEKKVQKKKETEKEVFYLTLCNYCSSFLLNLGLTWFSFFISSYESGCLSNQNRIKVFFF